MSAPKPGDWFGQPRGLTILFLTDMWEKFSYFGMRALLIYYMTKQLLMDQQQASLIYGLYTAFVYFTPIFGGIITDRWLGRHRAVIIGGAIMAIGHFMMTFEPLFFGALACIAIGNGLFLPGLPAHIPSLYEKGDRRIKSAYNIYYVGTNLGAFLAPLVCGTIGEVYGWHYGFGLAGIGMILGLIVYVSGGKALRAVREEEDSATPHPESVHDVRAPQSRDEIRRRFLLLIGIMSVVVLFRGAYEQMGNTVALWADTGVDRSLGNGWSIPMTWFQSIDPMMVFIFTPMFLAHWSRMARRGSEPSSMVKMALGAWGVAISYLLLAGVAAWTGSQGVQASWIWLALFFVLLTAGELYILPVGFGLFGRLAPARFAATTIATWYAAAFAGNLLAGVLGTLWSVITPAAFFTLMAAVAAAAGIILLLFNKAVRGVEGDDRPDMSVLRLET